MIDKEFENILEKMAKDKMVFFFLETKKFKSILSDYARNEFKKECSLLLIIHEADSLRHIDAAEDIVECKQSIVRHLEREHFLSPSISAEMLDVLFWVLRGKRIQTPTVENVIIRPSAKSASVVIPSIQTSLISIQSAGITITPKKGSIIPFGGYDWLVLDVEKGKALILSEEIIGKMAYHHSWKDTTWADCELRGYLNDAFYNKFNSQDKACITETRITTNDNPWYGTKGGNATNDKIFLLSIEEFVRYFGDNDQLKNKNPNSKYWIDDQYKIAKNSSGSALGWWLRSPDNASLRAAYVNDGGHLYVGGNDINNDCGGVRPALWLKL